MTGRTSRNGAAITFAAVDGGVEKADRSHRDVCCVIGVPQITGSA